MLQIYKNSCKLLPSINLILFHKNTLNILRQKYQCLAAIYYNICPKAKPASNKTQYMIFTYINTYIFFQHNVKRLFKTIKQKEQSNPSLCAFVWKCFWWFSPTLCAFRRASGMRIMKKPSEPLGGIIDLLSFVLDESSMKMMVAGLKWLILCDSVCSNRDRLRGNILGLVIWGAAGLTLTDRELLHSAGRLLQCLISLSYGRERESLNHITPQLF